ncbi:type VII secretion-associated serine protease mycosin [Streptomyces sp. NPDC005181]|uniref:type VII secretion-associated serine protease mycosin n=1 Tax=Streptomyces sp. NPDC005181 TaxID=3156869 RepID=UPI0033B61722
MSAASGLLLVGVVAVPASADSTRSMQWHLDAMKADEMWKTSTGKGVTVAVIDSGVDPSNPDLGGQVLKGKDLEPDVAGDEHTDYDGHGTSMAGLIAGTGRSNGGNGAFGLAPGAKILPVRMPESGVGATQTEGDEEFNKVAPVAIRYAVERGARVISISLGAQAGSQELTDAVKYALDKGSLIFAAAGNSGDAANLVEYPSGTPGVIGVGAIGHDAKKTDESQYGPQIDFTAPGIDMVHPCTGGTQLCKTSGTSDATAIASASASAALIWSKHPDWTNNQVLRVMLNTVGAPTSGAKRNDYVGYGIVRPRIALKNPGDPGPADVYPLPDLAAAESPSPSAEPSEATGSPEGTDKPAAAPASDDGSSDTGPWIGLGIGAAAVIGAAVTALAIRSRRRKTVVATPSSYPYPQPHNPYHAYGPPPTHNRPPEQGPAA